MEEVEVQIPGKAWKNSAFKETFEEADTIRVERLLEKGTEAKVKWMPSMNKFVVKVRVDPIVASTEKLIKKNKKKRKK